MKRGILAAVSVVALAGAAGGMAIAAAPQSAATSPLAKAAVGPVHSVDSGQAQLGDFGFDVGGMDKSVLPGNDFYAYANGTWAKDTAIPSDESAYGAFNVLADLSRERTRAILDDAKDDPNSKIGTAYATYLDTAAIDAKGLAPIKPWLDTIDALDGKAGYPALLAKAARDGIDGPFGAYVSQDDKNPEFYALGLSQSGLGMPDRDYYLNPKKDPKLAEAKAAYLQHIQKMFELAGMPDAAARAQAILDFETRIAQVSWTRTDSRDADKTYNKMTVAQLVQSAPGFDFATFFKEDGVPSDSVIVAQPSAVTGIAKIVADTPLQVLKDQLILRSLDNYADVLPSAFDKENFHFYGTVLSGTPQQKDRWKRGVDFVTGALTDDVSKIYVGKYFPPETKAAAQELVHNLIQAFSKRLDKLAWMSPATKAKAQAKLAAFTPRIGYPDKWHDYSNLTISAGDAFGNELRANQWQHDWNAQKLGKPIMRWEWGMTPMTVNAYSNFGQVEIVFPAAILQPPFFDPKADPAVNYGGIGAVIGHEMSHQFDDQGSKYDLHGKLETWWTPQDRQRFEALTDKLGKQYDAYEPLPGQHVNGKLTMGENIADLAGLNTAYDAYHASLGGKTAPVIDGFTGDQRFYLGWAQVWRQNVRDAARRQRLLTDPHSPNPQRAWIVRDMDPWYPAFDVKPGQKLYLTPDQRVKIW
ncbi:M13 family metallopeptidase [Hephaestia mangrovi]|uniref:M13 family metallopeptidase n=1 Tax=Hephaestia mangrovi TaxID=2873268 RepID=UPI001CA6A6CB|nr:M13-type metalloendopeptidase [Hephaestia mangrovi]MBY8827222.1 M13 family peptidase [Hephaestia mangrovi]